MEISGSTLKRKHGRMNLKDDQEDDDEEFSMPIPSSMSMSMSSSSMLASSTRQSSLPINPLPNRNPYRPFESDDEDMGVMRRNGCKSTPVEIVGFESTKKALDIDGTVYATSSSPLAQQPFDSMDVDTDLDSVTTSTSYSSIVHTLPTELLNLIFEAGALFTHPSLLQPKSPYVPISLSRPHRPFLMTVMHVCHRWRSIAIHTPSLWTTIHISRSKRGIDRMHRVEDWRSPIPWVADYLTRSQNLLLDISVECPNLSVKGVFAQLSPEVHRWRSLRIIIPSVQDLPTFLSSLKKVVAVPQLEELEITSLKYHDSLSPPISLGSSAASGAAVLFRTSQHLSTIRLNRVNMSWLAFPLRELTTLELRFVVWPSYPHLAEMLSGSPNLQTLLLHIDNTAAKLLERHTRPPISILSLKRLEIRLFSQGQPTICPFLQIFHTPALESLTMRDVTSSDWCRILVYFRVHSTAYPLLRHLTLSSIKGLISVDSSAVRAFPQLKHLHLSRLYSNAFFRLLEREKTDDMYRVPVWPKLTRITVDGDPDLCGDLVARAQGQRERLGRPVGVIVM